MGLRGRIPENNVIQMLKGNPAKRPRKPEAQLPPPDESRSGAPKRLKYIARDEWERLYGMLVERGVVHAGNLSLFEDYCFALGELRRCENLTKTISADMAIMRGYFKAASVFRQQVRQLARDLRLTELAGEKIGSQEGKLAKFIALSAEKPSVG